MSVWRLIPPLKASGGTQMAIDAWLFDQHCKGLHPPTLRFYTWEPVAISLGYHQRHYPDHWKQVLWQGSSLDLVRRPTGGRAVLHQGDLTYAVITSDVPGNRFEAYQWLCEFLIQGWRSLGVELYYGKAGRGYIRNPNCFGTATAADLVLQEGTKLIGSAQLRRGNVVLQHGSMRLNQSAQLFQEIFQADPLLPNLPLQLIQDNFYETVITKLIKAAETCFNATFQTAPLSDNEYQMIRAFKPLNYEAQKPPSQTERSHPVGNPEDRPLHP